MTHSLLKARIVTSCAFIPQEWAKSSHALLFASETHIAKQFGPGDCNTHVMVDIINHKIPSSQDNIYINSGRRRPLNYFMSPSNNTTTASFYWCSSPTNENVLSDSSSVDTFPHPTANLAQLKRAHFSTQIARKKWDVTEEQS